MQGDSVGCPVAGKTDTVQRRRWLNLEFSAMICNLISSLSSIDSPSTASSSQSESLFSIPGGNPALRGRTELLSILRSLASCWQLPLVGFPPAQQSKILPFVEQAVQLFETWIQAIPPMRVHSHCHLQAKHFAGIMPAALT